MDTGIDPPNTPNDFPVDSGLHERFVSLVGAGAGFVLCVAFGLVLWWAYRRGYDKYYNSATNGVDQSLVNIARMIGNVVIGVGSKGEKISEKNIKAEALIIVSKHRAEFKHTTDLLKKISGPINQLKLARDGKQEVEAPAEAQSATVNTGPNTGTIVNIALSQGLTGQAETKVTESKVTLTQTQRIMAAIEKLYEPWKIKTESEESSPEWRKYFNDRGYPELAEHRFDNRVQRLIREQYTLVSRQLLDAAPHNIPESELQRQLRHNSIARKHLESQNSNKFTEEEVDDKAKQVGDVEVSGQR